MLKLKTFLAFKLSGVVFMMLINVKMTTIVVILTFMSMIIFMLNLVEHEKLYSFETLAVYDDYQRRYFFNAIRNQSPLYIQIGTFLSNYDASCVMIYSTDYFVCQTCHLYQTYGFNSFISPFVSLLSP